MEHLLWKFKTCHLITLYSLRESLKAIWSYEQAIKLGLCVHFSQIREWNRLSLCVQQETEGLSRREYAGSLYLASPRHLFWERTQLSLLARRSRSRKDLTLWILPWSRPSALPNGVTGVQMGLWDTLNIWRDMHCMTVIYGNKETRRSTRAYSMWDRRMNLVFALIVIEEDKARKWELDCMNVFMT